MTPIRSSTRIQIKSIRILYVIKGTNLNHDFLNVIIGYYIISQYNSFGEYLQRHLNKIRGAKFYSVDIIRDPSGAPL